MAISSDFGFSDLFTDMGSKAYAAATKFLLYSVTLLTVSYYELALICSHKKSFYASLLDPGADKFRGPKPYCIW